MSIVTLDPTNGPLGADVGFRLAERPPSLSGQVLGVIANGLGDSEIMFDALAQVLSETEDLAGVVKVVKPNVSVPPWPRQWANIKEHATVAVTGFGGCGSCSTRSMRDALDLEEAGIPAVCVVHTALVPAVQAMARLVGAADYPVVIVDYPHNPTAHWTKEEALALAAEIAPAVNRRLVRPPAGDADL